MLVLQRLRIWIHYKILSIYPDEKHTQTKRCKYERGKWKVKEYHGTQGIQAIMRETA